MNSLRLMTLAVGGLFLAGCLENGTGAEVIADLNTDDFEVVTEPQDGSGGNNSSASTGTETPNPDASADNVVPLPQIVDGFDINKGGVLTGSNTLSLDFYPPFFSAFTKISENETCRDGSWSPYKDFSDYIAVLKNQSVPLSVQFRDHDGRVSACYTRRIYIDQVGPEIHFVKYPTAPVEEATDVEIVFSVSDEGAGVSQVTCTFAGVTKTCGIGVNKITFPKMASGDYVLSVSASDKLGSSSSKSISFKVSSFYKKMAQSATVIENNKVDILFVVDNSGSMAYEQKSMASRVRNFLDVVKGLDWQIAVTTTDPTHKTFGDGRLVPLYGSTNSYIMNSTLSDADARTTLGMTLQRSETGSGAEQGIFAAYRAVERSLASTGANTNFIRDNSQLAVVLISDEDESADGVKNKPANFVEFIRSHFSGQKVMTFHSIIARPNDSACLNGEGYSAGYRYDEMSKMTGGVIGDVCATDYAAQVQGIAEGVRDSLKSISLSCAPVIDNVRSLVILKDGQAFTGSYQIQGLNIVFDQMLPGGQYSLEYSCLK